MVYYDCPGLCGLTLSDLVHSLKQVNLEPAHDYNVVIVSFNPAEKPALAAAKKTKYAESFGKPSFNAGWHFLTGQQQAISKLASAVGFRYRLDEPTHQFVHAAGIMIATPAGKLSRYFYGIQYSPTDLRLSLVEASVDKIGSPVDNVLLFCCPYESNDREIHPDHLHCSQIGRWHHIVLPVWVDLFAHTHRQQAHGAYVAARSNS